VARGRAAARRQAQWAGRCVATAGGRGAMVPDGDVASGDGGLGSATLGTVGSGGLGGAGAG
jgi:hypothetical protein